MSKSITQDMAYRQSLMKYAEKYGVSRASRKYNKSRSYIYSWKARWDGSVASLACRSRRPHSLGLIELWYRLKQRGCTRFSNSKRDSMTLFEKTAGDLGIRHRLIRPYTPRHNGKVERSHREDQKRFYSCHSFFSLEDFEKQLTVHNRRSNNFPMRPLYWLSSSDFLLQHV